MEKSLTKLVSSQLMREYSTLSIKTRPGTHKVLVIGTGNKREINNLQYLKPEIRHHG